ncbi:MAG TPA: type I DNA topoisomerase [Cyanobacteria bacterium UBA8803]|nr:type I DNA topoisomerase [Cyanobacteria bacterium UBA9273]HBL58757.1 type I DNA topoisomerase [Cyanobacteria bacterium UBA8803]
MANLLIIESGGKVKKLKSILGAGWSVKASMGHVRELADDGQDALGFDLDGAHVRCRYVLRNTQAQKIISELRGAVRQADRVYLATDPDREGETIGWHLTQELRLKNPLRVTYTEITKSAVEKAIANPRTLDPKLVAAGRARDCLDKLVGYKGSQLVWRLNNGCKSMGRVQSATLHLLVKREQEILAFKPQDYWVVWVEYKEGFKAFYAGSANQQTSKTPSEKSTDGSGSEKDDTGEEDPVAEGKRVLSQVEADRLVAIARSHAHQVVKVESKRVKQSPPAAFTTSTLQQAAGSKLKLNPEVTMKIAQKLYEAGHITYMRTDSVILSPEFCAAARQWLLEHDPNNVPSKVAFHRSKSGAQEAHEAIRPTHIERTPQLLSSQMMGDEAKLYGLIWNRAIATQCCPAQIAKTRIVTQSGAVLWEARGQVLIEPGYTRYWNNIASDSQLPPVQEGQPLTLDKADAEKRQTQPPPRYTEPKLVQVMERSGIGRPSTYAPTIKTLKARNYVQLIKGKLQPTLLGMELDEFLAKVLPDLIQPEFTAKMEADLDAIASGKLDWERYLTDWHRDYFAPALNHAVAQVQVLPKTNQPQTSQSKSTQPKTKAKGQTQNRPQTEQTDYQCPKCQRPMVRVFSKSQKLKADHFLSCDNRQGGCGAVMFWNPTLANYELPKSSRPAPPANPSKLTEHPCPSCGQPLELYEYTRDGQIKKMLRCSNPTSRQDQCKDVAYFWTKNEVFWSPKLGELKSKERQKSNR